MPQNRRAFLTDALASGTALLATARSGLSGAWAQGALPPPDTPGVIWKTAGDVAAKARAFNKRTAKTAQYRAVCQTEAGAAEALEWARANAQSFSILSGGHCFEGFSQSETAVIDMSAMNSLALTPDRELVAGPGATLGEMNTATDPISYALPAGYCPTVGLGGHIGGGGIGLWSRAYGLACDHLLSARVLIANGQIVTASATENADLFWALRGGGSGSFGIITSFTFRLRPIPRATLIEMHWDLPPAEAGKFLTAWQRSSYGADRRVTSFLYAEPGEPGLLRLRLRFLSIADRATSVAAAMEIYQIARPVTEPYISEGTFLQVSDRLWPRGYMPEGYFKFASNFMARTSNAATWESTMKLLEASRGTGQALVLETLGGAIDDLPKDGTAYAHRGAAKFLFQFETVSRNRSGLDKGIPVMRALQQSLSADTTGGAYVNYPDLDLPNWQNAYWGDNYERLTRIKAKYDPGNLFRHAQSVPPAKG